MAFIYSVTNASWDVAYDIRVYMGPEGNRLTLAYKAAITQDTAEDWTDVPLTLETASQIGTAMLFELQPWNLSVRRKRSRSPTRIVMASPGSWTPPPVIVSERRRSRSRARSPQRLRRSRTRSPSSSSSSEVLAKYSPLEHRVVEVSSKGSASATYSVPGTISIPSDGSQHYVIIAELHLDPSMEWLSIPKIDPRVHLKTKIKNSSEYTLLPGEGKVYIDGSFLANSSVPLVNPQQDFECSLGLDPAIKVTYHPRTMNSSKSGIIGKTSNQEFDQRITIQNNKLMTADRIRILDQIPVSQDSVISVKLITPALTMHPNKQATSTSNRLSMTSSMPSVQTSKGNTKATVNLPVDEEDNRESGNVGFGKNGKMEWICLIPAQEKVHLSFNWKVTYPEKADIIGL